jgi:uncharacterized protein
LGKIFLFVVLALVVYAVFKGAAASKRRRPPNSKAPERMVTCAQCGVHLPESEALEDSGRFFCSEDHRRRNAA